MNEEIPIPIPGPDVAEPVTRAKPRPCPEALVREPLGALQHVIRASEALHGVWDEAIECVANLEAVDMRAIDPCDRPLVEGTAERLDSICHMLYEMAVLLGCPPDDTGQWQPPEDRAALSDA